MTEIKDWAMSVKEIRLPRWEDLPELSLYLDQVLEYVNDNISAVFIEPVSSNSKQVLTDSMINNYVKNKLMPAPVKKRYQKDHIAFIITITILKQVATLSSVSRGIQHMKLTFGKIKAYNLFIDFLENALKVMTEQLEKTPDEAYFIQPIDYNLLPMKTATLAFASKMMSEYLLKEIHNITKENKE
ncbi:conserved hypothetical protein (DUF1836) [Alteracholeplasma palmae J233]|uniref:DUF1836 domain-containing protein n=1 Tax=Alteracholeplasma palmae (strain ATCC 49389 / J233) TaxID=1318466 RepID=U4KLG2_ALTPJ|nr:DUF1836 domain-containing protein [Alteracholeplasma palmae]CCV64663.1 conserved hypothetical protein (DUF1836) [Alteracholeplasma palmae J233]